MKIKLRKNDEVVVIAGREKGKVARINRVDAKNNKVYLKDLNIVTKHVKPTQGQDGSIKRFEAPIHASNVTLLIKKATKTNPAQFSKIGYKLDKNGKKVRIARRTQKEL